LPDRCRADIVRVPSGEYVRAADLTSPIYPREQLPISQLAVSPDGKGFAAVGDRITRYDLEEFVPRWIVEERCPAAEFSHDSQRLIAVHADALRAYDANTGHSEARETPIGKRSGPVDWLTTVAVDPVGKWVYAGAVSGKVYVFAADTLKPRAS